MINDYTVHIRYKNKFLEDIGDNVYTLPVYTNMLSLELKKCLNDIEDSFKQLIGDDSVDLKKNRAFMNIRGQILDAANGINRLPETMCYKGVPIKAINASDFISNVIDNT